ncbi:hypothetical protein GGF32_004344 [Allomyces javanicus]|nr:hypothetical protein GGF32_004344 [Allomyces javanicus]
MSASSRTFTDSRPNSYLPATTDDVLLLEPLFPPTCAPGAHVDTAVYDCDPDAVLTTKDLLMEEDPLVGLQYSFGIYQKYLPNAELKGRVTAVEVSLIGSVSCGVMNLLSVYSGRLANVYGYRLMVFVGTLIMVVGLVLSAFSTELWHFMVTQGLLVRIGCSIAYFSGVAVNAQWWDWYWSLAMGIVVAGASASGLAFANGSEVLLNMVGLKWTLLITALVTLVLQFVAVVLLKTRIPTWARPLCEALNNAIDWQLFKTCAFPPLIIGVFLNPFDFILSYCQAQGLADTSGALLLTVINITSVIGRIVVGFLAD